MDYFAPELKENIIIRENVQKLDQEKIDVWSFGFILHKIFMFELPIFDPARKPIIKDTKMSSGLVQLINSCLRLNPAERPRWADIDFMRIKREKKDEVTVVNVVEEV
jgi:serine/threonine protein kinase